MRNFEGKKTLRITLRSTRRLTLGAFSVLVKPTIFRAFRKAMANYPPLVSSEFAPLRGTNVRVDFVERFVRSASRREPIVRPAYFPE